MLQRVFPKSLCLQNGITNFSYRTVSPVGGCHHMGFTGNRRMRVPHCNSESYPPHQGQIRQIIANEGNLIRGQCQ